MVILPLMTAFLLTMAVLPFVIRTSYRFQAFDAPDIKRGSSEETGRKVHEIPVPRIGGLAFVFAFLLTYALFAPRSPFDAVVFASVGAFALGFVDDLIKLSALVRLVGQVALAGLLVWFLDLYPQFIYISPETVWKLPPLIGIAFGIFVIVGAINAFNMIDGMDGQATLCGLISLLALSMISVSFHGEAGIFLFVVGPMIGALLGFLRSNVHPADIFMGDGGSNWLGYNVGVFLLLYLTQKSGFFETTASMKELLVGLPGRTPLLVFGLLCVAVPVVDAASVMASRMARGHNPMSADRRHIHHRLLNFGLGHGAVVSGIALIAAGLAVLGVVLALLPPWPWTAALGHFVFFTALFLVLSLANEWIKSIQPLPSFKGSLRPAHTSSPPGSSWLSFFVPFKFLSLVLADILAVSVGLYLGFLLRLDFLLTPNFLNLYIRLWPLAVISHLMLAFAFRQYQQIYRFATLGTIFQLIRSHFLALILFSVMIYFSGASPFVPKSIILMQFILTMTFSGIVRFIPRIAIASGYFVQERSKPRCLVYGAGVAGEQLARQIQSERNFPFTIAGFIDDDLAKQGKFLHGCRILGTGHDLPEICQRYHVQNILVAMHSLDSASLRTIAKRCQDAGAKPLLMPDLKSSISLKNITPRPIDLNDLIQRRAAATDRIEIDRLIRGQVILVAGAGGSMGSELCRQIITFQPKKLILVDFSESGLLKTFNELRTTVYEGFEVIPALGIMTDKVFVDDVIRRFQPKIIINSAAHKSVELSDLNPTATILNNLHGAKVLALSALEHKVPLFLELSSHSALLPTSVVDATHRCSELVLQGAQLNPACATRFVSVRFSTVLGNTGSLIPDFMEQIKAGGPVKVSSPEVSQHFILAQEACALILQCLILGQGGDIFTLKSGEVIKIYDMACQLIRFAGREPGRDIEIQFTGLSGADKSEELQKISDLEVKTDHPDIVRIQYPAFDFPQVLAQLDSCIDLAKNGKRAEALHAMWSALRQSNCSILGQLKPQHHHHAPLN